MLNKLPPGLNLWGQEPKTKWHLGAILVPTKNEQMTLCAR